MPSISMKELLEAGVHFGHQTKAIAEEATRCNMYYVNNRWLGGLLTNFVTVQRSIKRLKDLDSLFASDDAGASRSKK